MRISVAVVCGYAVVLLVAEAAVAWYTSSLNGWLLRPEAMILAGGSVLAVGWAVYALGRHSALGAVAASTSIGLTVFMCVLAYSFALPLKVLKMSPTAVRSARALIGHLNDSMPGAACSRSDHYLAPVASVIKASQACAERPTIALVSYGRGGSYLYFGPSGPVGSGLTYWPESCSRHLYGPWWALHTYNPDSTAMGGGRACPLGFRFVGGP